MPTDNSRELSRKAILDMTLGLPDDGFVFAALINNLLRIHR